MPISCPEGPQRCAECAECVRQRLLHRPGIRSVVIHPNGSQARITLDYDTTLIALSELERDIRRNGGCFSPDWGHAVIPVEGMISSQSEQLIETVLRRIPGVMATASHASRLVRVEFDRRRCAVPEIIARLNELGYPVRPDSAKRFRSPGISAGVLEAHDGERGRRMIAVPRPSLVVRLLKWLAATPELALPLLGGLFLLLAFLIHSSNGSNWLRGAFLVFSYLCCSRYTGMDTLRSLRHMQFNIDVLMFIAAGGAISLGRHEEGALLLMLFGVGTAGENLAMDRARRAIHALAELAPETATVRDADGRERVVHVADLAIGDQVVIRPFDRMPADGEVISGASAVDQSPITGESMPVEKTVGLPLYAGTINGNGAMVMKVVRAAGETKLAKIIKLVEEAQTTKSPTQVLTDQVERFYVPLVFISTACLIVLPITLADGAWSVWFYRAMAFLTAASPCALAIGTPAAVLSGIARAARGGVLIKGGVHLENLGRVRAIAFDKTGTLTRGRAEVTNVTPIGSHSIEEILGLAAAVEQESTHPLAAAITAEAKARGCRVSVARDVQQTPGIGVTGVLSPGVYAGCSDPPDINVRALRVAVGRITPEHIARSPELKLAAERMEADGKTVVVVSVDLAPIGAIALADHPRERVREVLDELRRLGVRRTVMLTGDNARVAAAIAKQIGADEYFAELLPEDKVDRLRDLERRFGRTAMVGDGINDAPALATATVGIAMGGAGTDVALETADVALMADALEKLPEAIGLSRFSRRIILQNLCIALGVIAIMAPTAALGGATLGVAVVAHEGSTVLVVLNALRLLLYKPKPI